MANLPEADQWEAGIYQLEITDPVLGGAEGIDNLQAKQLANRTLYLKNLLANLQAAESVDDHEAKPDPHSQYLDIGHLDDQDPHPQYLTQQEGDALYKAITAQSLPVGASIMVNSDTPPTGTVEEDGSLLSRASYPDLWAYAQTSGNLHTEAEWFADKWGGFSDGDGATTFRLPDSRGEAIRGWDHGRGVDAGRGLGSAQSDDNKAHNHIQGEASYSAQSLSFGKNTEGYTAGHRLAVDGGSLTPNPLTSTRGTESRPRNIPKMICIKY